MSQYYTDPSRESDPYSLPDLEVFYADAGELECQECGEEDHDCPNGAGWYWWSCLPGCLPDDEANGPFETEEQALEDARDLYCPDCGGSGINHEDCTGFEVNDR